MLLPRLAGTSATAAGKVGILGWSWSEGREKRALPPLSSRVSA